MGVHHATVYRLTAGTVSPSGAVIEGLQRAFPGRDIAALIE